MLNFLLLLILLFVFSACSGTDEKYFRQVDHYELNSDHTLPLDLVWHTVTEVPLAVNMTLFEDETAQLIVSSSYEHVYALNQSDGSSAWTQEGFESDYLPIRDGFVYATINHQLEVLDVHTGQRVWVFTPSDYIVGQLGTSTVSFLAFDQEKVYALVNLHRASALFVLHAKTGDILWRTTDEFNKHSGSPRGIYLYNGILYVRASPLWKFNPETGEILARAEPGIPHFHYPPLYRDGILYGNGAIAVSLESKEVLWDFDGPDAPGSEFVMYIDEDSVYVSAHQEHFYRLDRQTGQPDWHFRLEDGDHPWSFTIFDGIGFLQSRRAIFYAIDLATGEKIGEMHVQPAYMPGTFSQPHMAANDHMLVVGFGNQELFAFKRK